VDEIDHFPKILKNFQITLDGSLEKCMGNCVWGSSRSEVGDMGLGTGDERLEEEIGNWVE
jgi:hypothetical protein